MLISELILKLEKIKLEQGDLPVYSPSFVWGSEDGPIDDFAILRAHETDKEFGRPNRLEISFSDKF